MFIKALGDNKTIRNARKMIVVDDDTLDIGVKTQSISAMAIPIPLSPSATIPAVER